METDSDEDDLPVMRVAGSPSHKAPNQQGSPAVTSAPPGVSKHASGTSSETPVRLHFDLSAIDQLVAEPGPPSGRAHLDDDDADLSRAHQAEAEEHRSLVGHSGATAAYLRDEPNSPTPNSLGRSDNEPAFCTRRRWLLLMAALFVALILYYTNSKSSLEPLPEGDDFNGTAVKTPQ